MKKSKKFILLAGLILLFLFDSYCAVTDCFQPMELKIAHFINPNADENIVMMLITATGEYFGDIAIIAVFLLIPKTRCRVGLPTAVTTLSSCISGKTIKHIIRRARPIDRLLGDTFLKPGGYSFPSGHALNSTTMYLCIMLLLLPLCTNKGQKAMVIAVCSFMPAIIGFSRVYFNVHYVSDVIGGWALGVFFAIVGTSLYFKLKGKAGHGKNLD